MSKLNKENFRLLDLSSDEESEDLQLDIVPRKKKVTRRDRNRQVTPQAPDPSLKAEIQRTLRWALRGTLVLWLVTLTWACAALYEQVSTMRTDIVRVSTSSNGVGDALQLCHTAAKELRANASELSIRLARLEQDHTELAKRVDQAARELAAVSEQLSAAPKLADTPRRLAELQRTVADFGSQINGFDSALKSAHKQAAAASAGVDEVKGSLHTLELRANDTVANVTAQAQREDELVTRLGQLNSTLTAKVDELRTRIDTATRTSMTAFPTPTTRSTAAAARSEAPPAAPGISSTSTVATPPDPPAKPSILQ